MIFVLIPQQFKQMGFGTQHMYKIVVPELVQASDSVGLGRVLRICISNKLPDVEAPHT